MDGLTRVRAFKAYTKQFLAPTLTGGDIVFVDNVSVHKVGNPGFNFRSC
jgi:hypothetical protein